MLVTLFSLFAEIERDLVSQRTTEALRALKRSGKRLGRPKGHGKLILEDREDQVRKLLELQLSYSAISRMLRVDRATVLRFVKRYKIDRPTK
jgi:DNA invertase Pin-like site-specific DNA recombinase